MKREALPAIQLPPPTDDESISLFAALKLRKTVREFDSSPLTLQQISNLLLSLIHI